MGAKTLALLPGKRRGAAFGPPFSIAQQLICGCHAFCILPPLAFLPIYHQTNIQRGNRAKARAVREASPAQDTHRPDPTPRSVSVSWRFLSHATHECDSCPASRKLEKKRVREVLLERESEASFAAALPRLFSSPTPSTQRHATRTRPTWARLSVGISFVCRVVPCSVVACAESWLEE